MRRRALHVKYTLHHVKFTLQGWRMRLRVRACPGARMRVRGIHTARACVALYARECLRNEQEGWQGGYGGVLYSALHLQIFSAKFLGMSNFFLDEKILRGFPCFSDL